jgi:hypothetical protein
MIKNYVLPARGEKISGEEVDESWHMKSAEEITVLATRAETSSVKSVNSRRTSRKTCFRQ